MSEEKHKIKISKLQLFQVLTVVLAIALLASFAVKTTGCMVADVDTVGKNTVDFINNNLLPPGVSATYINGRSSHGMYNLSVTIGNQTGNLFVSADGKLLFINPIDMSQSMSNPQQDQQQQTEIPKTDKPVVKLFVMSYCPFGTQMEKGIIPVIKTLGDKIDFQVEFVYYAMHGEKEIKENMLQVCIQKEYRDKYIDYLECFLEAGDSQGCIEKIGFNNATLTTCMDNLDTEYNITAMYNDQSTWLSGRYPLFPVDKADNDKYNVGGSPTLVINDVVVQSGRDSASLLSTICSAFTNPPEECNTELSSTTPSPGFGYEGSGTNSGSCG
ncbi:MAG: hypothetical protein J7K73_03565 [Nanoarchaeota archaeon]|nr:hypothetical protein [Nanoarchaeota archaeon]